MLTLGRLQELRGYVDQGPWRFERSRVDGALLLYDSADNPIAQVYAGHDLALYLEACAPDSLLGPKT